MGFDLIDDQFNGTITNDKFCLSRMGRLQLSWWRLPLRARVAVAKDTTYPADANEMERCTQEGTYEETSVDRPASHDGNCRRTATVGSSLPMSCTMECRSTEGVASKAHSTGEER